MHAVRCSLFRASQRPSSRRTRIKTMTSFSLLYTLIILRDHLPEEQGLRRPDPARHSFLLIRPQRPSSRRTRIKTTEKIVR